MWIRLCLKLIKQEAWNMFVLFQVMWVVCCKFCSINKTSWKSGIQLWLYQLLATGLNIDIKPKSHLFLCLRLQLWNSGDQRGWQKRSKLHHRGEFRHNYYTFVSLHDSDHKGVVRIFVALSCELWGYLHYLFTLYKSSGNRTPGSSFYSYLLDTSVCINQLVLKRCLSARLFAWL